MMSGTDPYLDFLARKTPAAKATGLSEAELSRFPLSPYMKRHQQLPTRWALQRGKAALFKDTGLGKTLDQLEWARIVSEYEQAPVLGLTPLAVAEQTCQEAAKFGIAGVAYANSQARADTPIVITNYDRVHLFNPDDFCGVFLDECFAPGTPVDMADGSVLDIEKISPGNYIKNAYGIDRVRAVARREVFDVVKVRVGLSSYFCSSNHPWFTHRGWIAARNLRANDLLSHTATAVLLVREGISPWARGKWSKTFLQQELLRELADEHAGTQGEGSYVGSGGKARQSSFAVAKGDTGGAGGRREFHSFGSYASGQGQSFEISQSHRSQTLCEDGQRYWANRSRASFDGCVAEWVDSRVSDLSRRTQARISNLLQSGYRISDSESSDRSGWSLAQIEEGSGREKRYGVDFSRVESIEILELGNPALEKFRDANGSFYFYDIEATRHPSFSVGGNLVHNSSIIKSHDSKTRAQLIEMFKNTKWKLCCSATPAPNDYTELGNHAEFLNVMSEKEMLSMFFVHDGSVRAHGNQEWRLKRHAESDFWRWLASWAVVMRSPADLGFDEPGYDLPPLIHHQITVPAEYAPQGGYLFPMEARTMSERLSVRRESLDARIIRAIKLIKEEEECGNQNTQLRKWQGIIKTKNTDNELLIAEKQKKASNITENIIRRININGENEHRKKMPREMQIEEQNMPHFQNIEKEIQLSQQKNISSEGKIAHLDQNTELEKYNTRNFLANKMESAPSVDQTTEKKEKDLELTIPIKMEQSEDCFATNAILESDHFQITQNFLKKPLNISRSMRRSWIIWCHLNKEQDLLEKMIGPRAISVYGSLPNNEKIKRIGQWLNSDGMILLSKPSICGFGLNLQKCSSMVFIGLNDSFEQLYQAKRRCWRYGQTEPVHVYLIASELEGAVVSNVERKEREFEAMQASMSEHMKDLVRAEVLGSRKVTGSYAPRVQMEVPGWL